MPRKSYKRYWWVVLMRGIFAILFALCCFFWTGLTLEILVLLFAILAIADGFFNVMSSVDAAKKDENWGVLLLEGLLGIIIGALIIGWPAITLTILVYLVGAWAIVTGIIEIWASFATDLVQTAKYLLMVIGIISLILGIVVLAYPLATLAVVIWILGIYALIAGIALIAFSVQVKRLV